MAKDLPKSKPIDRYWVELHDLRDGSTRHLPLSTVMKIHLPGKNGGSQKPNHQVLQLQDNSVVLEGGDVEDIVVQLRRKYPDDSHKRFLR